MKVLNEKNYAKECLDSGKLTAGLRRTLLYIANYLYHTKGLRRVAIEKKLIEFMQTHLPDYKYHILYYDDIAENTAKKAGRYPQHEINEVWITESEISAIEEISGDNEELLKQLAFTYLCIAKLNNLRNPKANNWVNDSAKDIFEMAHIKASSDRQDEMIGDLHILGLLDFAKRIDNLDCRVTFINNDSNKVLSVSDFRELGFEYQKYQGGSYIRCAECGILTPDNKNHTKRYCADCAGSVSLHREESSKTRTIICEDCGKEFEVASSNKRQTRCEDCYKIYRRRKKNDSDRKRRNADSLK